MEKKPKRKTVTNMENSIDRKYKYDMRGKVVLKHNPTKWHLGQQQISNRPATTPLIYTINVFQKNYSSKEISRRRWLAAGGEKKKEKQNLISLCIWSEETIPNYPREKKSRTKVATNILPTRASGHERIRKEQSLLDLTNRGREGGREGGKEEGQGELALKVTVKPVKGSEEIYSTHKHKHSHGIFHFLSL